jgi:hypothetical protein
MLSSRLTGSNLLMSLFPFLLHLSTWIGPRPGDHIGSVSDPWNTSASWGRICLLHLFISH